MENRLQPSTKYNTHVCLESGTRIDKINIENKQEDHIQNANKKKQLFLRYKFSGASDRLLPTK